VSDTEAGHPQPSDHARDLVRGAYDLHTHVAPDVMERRVTDLELARRSKEVGLAGFALKSHYTQTAERAAVVSAAVPGVDVLGAITLNHSVGGMNPIATEIAARCGARIVWMPTVDARNERESTAANPEGATPPMWARMQQELADRGFAVPPVEILDEDGRLRKDVRDVLSVIATHDMVLATGHLSAREIDVVVSGAAEMGVNRIIVTHPEFTSQRLGPEAQRDLAAKGALLERCFTTPFTKKVSWEDMFGMVRVAGPTRSVLSTDLGQPFNPPVEDGLALMADRFLEEGFSENEVHTMIVTNSAALARG
jgi:Family of unknown function (DUF6282)